MVMTTLFKLFAFRFKQDDFHNTDIDHGANKPTTVTSQPSSSLNNNASGNSAPIPLGPAGGEKARLVTGPADN